MNTKIIKGIGTGALALLMMILVCFSTGVQVGASSTLTGIGLAEHGLKAYREGWKYNYGSYGEFSSSGVRQSDCSGLIYSYLCWVDDNSNPVPNYSMARGATSQYRACSETGTMDTMPRTHGILLFYKTGSGDNCDHVGIYVGNDMSVDNSDYNTNMRYRQASTYAKWTAWGKLAAITYPTTGWYDFDGDAYYYENGEYVVNTTKTIDGVTYTFDSAGLSSKSAGSGSSGGDNSSNSGDSSLPTLFTTTTTAALNFRTGPSTSNSIIRVLSNGTSVDVLDTSNSEWYKIKTSDGTVGYVSSGYLASNSSSGSSGNSGSTSTVSIPAKTTAYVNFRTGPSTSYSVITTLASGTSVTITEKTSSSWYKVKTDGGQEGYLFADYVTENTSSSDNGNSGSSSSGSSGGSTAVTTAYLNLRSGPSTNDSIITVLSLGETITITDSSNASWYKVKTASGQEGYVSTQHITVQGGSSSSSDTMTTTAYVNLRSGAGKENSVITVVDVNTQVTVLDRSNAEWYKIRTSGGTEGYMSSQYLR